MAEIHEQPDLEARGAQVIHQLGSMFSSQSCDRLDLEEHFAEADEVCPIGLSQPPALIG